MMKDDERVLVHKKKDENVFLSHLRRILPPLIEKGAFEAMVAALSHEEGDMLHHAYPLHGAQLPGQPVSVVMRELAACMTVPGSDYAAFRATLPAPQAEALDQAYLPGPRGDFQLAAIPDEALVRPLLRFLGRNDHYLGNAEQAAVSEILEGRPEVEAREIFFATLVVNTRHPYFFEHENEHVPGMLVLEAARQMAMAVSHRYGGVGLGMHIILSMLEARFNGYFELYAPVLFRLEVLEKKTNKGVWTGMKSGIQAYQNGKVGASIGCNGDAISHGVFERIRKARKQELRVLPFRPVEEALLTLHLKALDKGTWWSAPIREISLATCQVSETGVEQLPTGTCDFVITGPGGSLVRGRCVRADGPGVFRFEALQDQDEEALVLMIKQNCRVPEALVN